MRCRVNCFTFVTNFGYSNALLLQRWLRLSLEDDDLLAQ